MISQPFPSIPNLGHTPNLVDDAALKLNDEIRQRKQIFANVMSCSEDVARKAIKIECKMKVQDFNPND